MFFPGAKGYTYRLAAPGIYMALGDFWLGGLTGKLQLEVVPGRGAVSLHRGVAIGYWLLHSLMLASLLMPVQVWAGSTHGSAPPGIAVRVSPLTVSLHIDDLGLRGDSIPPALRHIREIELSVVVDVYVPLAFGPPPRKLDGSAGAPAVPAASTDSSHGSGANALMKYVWRVLDSFRYCCFLRCLTF